MSSALSYLVGQTCFQASLCHAVWTDSDIADFDDETVEMKKITKSEPIGSVHPEMDNSLVMSYSNRTAAGKKTGGAPSSSSSSPVVPTRLPPAAPVRARAPEPPAAVGMAWRDKYRRLGAMPPAASFGSCGYDDVSLNKEDIADSSNNTNKTTNTTRNAHVVGLYSDESRDTNVTYTNHGTVVNSSPRDKGENFDSSTHLDDVISKMMRTRDALIQQKLKADEQVKQLGLENENLKNLVAIGKKVTQAQRDEITSVKMQNLQDKKRIMELELELQSVKTRTRNVMNDLSGSDLLSGLGCHVGSTHGT